MNSSRHGQGRPTTPIIGCHNDTVNTLRLWRPSTREEVYKELSMGTTGPSAIKTVSSRFRVSSILTIIAEDGRRLRLMQNTFLSAGVQSIVRHYKQKYGESIYRFAQYVAIHINDTHPALVIPELMRIFMDEEGLSWQSA